MEGFRHEGSVDTTSQSRFLLVILAGAACLRLYYIDQPFVDGGAGVRRTTATMLTTFIAVISISFSLRSAGTVLVRITSVTSFS